MEIKKKHSGKVNEQTNWSLSINANKQAEISLKKYSTAD